MTFFWNNECRECLIGFISQHPTMWKRKLYSPIYYKDNKALWQEAAKICGCSMEQAVQQFYMLKARYLGHKKKEQDALKNGTPMPKNIPLMNELSFLARDIDLKMHSPVNVVYLYPNNNEIQQVQDRIPECVSRLCGSDEKRLHTFPKDVETRNLWLRLLGRKDLTHHFKSFHRVCQYHFSSEMFDNSGMCLKQQSIPNQLLGNYGQQNLNVRIIGNAEPENMLGNQIQSTLDNQDQITVDFNTEPLITQFESTIKTEDFPTDCDTMEEYFEISEVPDQCRICMSYGTDMMDMMNAILQIEGRQKSLHEAYQEITGISVTEDDELPKYLCNDCVGRIKKCVLLRSYVEDSYRLMLEIRELDAKHRIESGDTSQMIKIEFNRQCRICMGCGDQMCDIFAEVIEINGSEGEVVPLYQLLEETIGISVSSDDGYARFLCTGCVTRVKESFLLRRQAEKVYKEFLKPAKQNEVYFNSSVINPNLAIKFEDIDCESSLNTNSKSSQSEGFTEAKIDLTKYECNVCYKRYPVQKHLMTHQLCHNKDFPFSCNICHKRFSKSDDSKAHLATHKGEKPYACNVCTQPFATLEECTVHIRSHNRGKPEAYFCPVCSNKFSTLSKRDEHFLTHEEAQAFFCKICCNPDVNKIAHKCTEKLVENIYFCGVCEASFQTFDLCKSHMLSHKPSRHYDCAYCRKTFSTLATRNRHEQTHK